MIEALSPLDVDIRRRIKAAGPMPVAEFMALCLSDPQHGYYMTHDPLGTAGDFTTAPEVSQIFGELIGLWMAATWRQMGSPENVRIVELGPGRGTMLKDALRAVQVMPAFLAAAVVHLVEISPALQAAQERNLDGSSVPVFWHDRLEDVPGGPSIIVANEFFDALPVNQAVKQADGWHQRMVALDRNGDLFYCEADEALAGLDRLLPESVRNAEAGEIFEWRTDTVAMEIGRRIAREPGAALVIDYGHDESATGDTLQAVGRHAFADPLEAPGTIDLTAHVDFQALSQAAECMGARAYGPLEQAELLRRLGIEARAAKLCENADREQTQAIDAAVARLTGRGRTGMGALFKAIAFAHSSVGTPPGLDA